ncbi:DM13 domain-containing protein [Marinilongibacter aquaticus]|uniref:DM13 domain-containing protein n=1 Tax=Marinilongibacter aquaticus TaxID=2975157 RepID=UPI0021BDA488|nr:DM13 domain-containing protein [Marinilongibacter aquaticus]UBM60520.1 DM13 domain-containing protein [Marinilongibacter aquaticus]
MSFIQIKNSIGLLLILSGTLSLSSCKEDKKIVNPATPIPGQNGGPSADSSSAQNAGNDKIIYEGEFKSYAHHTAGKAQITQNSQGDKHLVLRDFEYESGPDLHIYIANDEKANEYVDISTDLKPGDVQYSFSMPINFDDKPYVIIWCKQFTVNFGTAKLEKQ